MSLHLAEIVTEGGGHFSSQLVVQSNFTIVPLPPKCSELNP
jgi:hypothetical protein